MTETREVVIVGGGLAGLNCAKTLTSEGRSVLLLEQDERLGGRVQTDEVDGFSLDRGFQVLLTAYPEAKAVLNYQDLDLHPFYPGAMVRYHGAFERIVDPWRKPFDALRTLNSPVGSLTDRQKIASIRSRVRQGSVEELFREPETSTLNYLRQAGLSQDIIDSFFRPFFGGIFLDDSLRTSSRMFAFVFRMMADGDIALPRSGMGSIPAQLAASLPGEVVRTSCKVASISPGQVTLDSGEEIATAHIVVAVDGPSAAKLVPDLGLVPAYVSATNIYFAAEKAPMTEPILLLNGDEPGPVNNLVVPSAISPAYAPAGSALISATVLGQWHGEDDTDSAVRTQLRNWFGTEVDGWRHLRTYAIKQALPDQTPPMPKRVEQSERQTQQIFFCGDYLENGSINGALLSGRQAAEAILNL